MYFLFKILLGLSLGGLYAKNAGNESFPIYYYSAMKDGKEHWFLGTIHIGVSLGDLDCLPQIEERISKSDLLFLEQYIPLSPEERKTAHTGSPEERETVLSQLSQEERNTMETRRETFKRVYLPQFIEDGEHSFEDLSPEAQNFLLSIGQDPSDNLADYAKEILLAVYYEAFFSLPTFLDTQIGDFAFSEGLPIESLDSNQEIIDSLNNERNLETYLVTPTYIESLVENYNSLVNSYISRFLNDPILKAYKNNEDLESLSGLEMQNSDALLRKRNESWLEKFRTAHANPQNTSIFTAVGLAHLIGASNLLDMLEEEGFSVRRVEECPFPPANEKI